MERTRLWSMISTMTASLPLEGPSLRRTTRPTWTNRLKLEGASIGWKKQHETLSDTLLRLSRGRASRQAGLGLKEGGGADTREVEEDRGRLDDWRQGSLDMHDHERIEWRRKG